MLVTVLLVAGVAASMWLFWRRQHRELLKAAEQFPGPKALPFLGNAMMFLCSLEEMAVVVKNLHTEYGDIVKFWLGPDLNIVLSKPDEAKTAGGWHSIHRKPATSGSVNTHQYTGVDDYAGPVSVSHGAASGVNCSPDPMFDACTNVHCSPYNTMLLTSSKLSFKGPAYKYMREYLGEGILSGSGPTWRRNRKLANPNYGKRAIESYGPIFNKEVDLLMEELRKMPSDKQFNIYSNIVKTTSYLVCQTQMGLTKKQTSKLPYLQDIIDIMPTIYDIVFSRMTKWYLQIDPVFWVSGLYQMQRTFNAKISTFAKEVLNHRKEYLKSVEHELKNTHMEEDTMLSAIDRFILSDELNSEELEKETFTIFAASQEAAAKITSYLLLMMAYHPECQEKLSNEVRRVLGDLDREVTDEDLKQMPYLEMVFKELLRLFPIGAILQRMVTEDIALGSCYLPAGCSLSIPIYLIHRDPRYWKNPDAFDPERFNPENMERQHPNTYIPFSLGPMDCLGRYYAAKLVKTIGARVIREFKLSSMDSYKDLRIMIKIGVNSVNGYHVMIKRRSNSEK